MARILVIDSLDGDRVRAGLLARRHAVVIVSTAADGLEALDLADPHIVIMDHQLSDGSGLTMLVPKIAKRPLIMLSAADDQQTRVMALRGGADDFVGKPWDDDELAERVAAVMRRCYRPLMLGDPLTVGELVMDFSSVRVGGLRLDLTKTEHLLLMAVASRAGRIVPPEEVIGAVYGESSDLSEWHNIQVHLGRLRQKLAEAGVRQVGIRTVRGRGLSMDYVAEA